MASRSSSHASARAAPPTAARDPVLGQQFLVAELSARRVASFRPLMNENTVIANPASDTTMVARPSQWSTAIASTRQPDQSPLYQRLSTCVKPSRS